MSKEIRLSVVGVIGSVSVFPQGGSLRLILPKKAVRYLGLSTSSRFTDVGDEESDPEDLSFVLIITNKGLILRPFKEYLLDDDMRMQPREAMAAN
jgi:hypothetical protein